MVISTLSSSLTGALTRARPYARRYIRPAAIGVGAVLLVTVALVTGLRIARSGVLPGVMVADLDLSGMSEPEVRQAIASYGDRRSDAELTVIREDEAPQDDSAAPATVSATGAELGYRLDVEATTTAVVRRGRQLNPFTALADHVRAFGGTIRVRPEETIATEQLARWVEEAGRALRAEPVEGSLAFEGATVVRVDPAPGAEVIEDALREEALAAFLEGGQPTVRARTRPIAPTTTTEDVDEVLETARRALSAPVTLSRGDVAITLAPEQIGGVLEVRRRVDDGEATLELAADPDRLGALVPPEQLAALESEPQDATFEVSGNSVTLIDHRDGFSFDAPIAAEQLVEVATGSGSRSAELDGSVTPPDLTTDEARALEIVERVSSFTTSYPCCQSRVTNIHRIAELVDGVVIRPGETFSVNDFVGPRTVAKGFAPGGAIFDGEFVEQIGGGVSQFATTMFNAAFFGGYEIPDYKAHSYYISRYPVGREATLNYPNVDLKVHNNSPHGLLVKTSVTGTSVTVSFYGTTWVEISDSTGARRNFREPPVRYEENPALPPGSERAVQSGRQGFDITVVRILAFPDGREERESYFTRYLAEPRVIERNSAPPPPPEGQDGDDGGNGGDTTQTEPPSEPSPAPEADS